MLSQVLDLLPSFLSGKRTPITEANCRCLQPICQYGYIRIWMRKVGDSVSAVAKTTEGMLISEGGSTPVGHFSEMLAPCANAGKARLRN